MYRDASIQVVANGFIINIGCQTVVAETPAKLKQLINDYIDNPEKAEQELMENNMRGKTPPEIRRREEESQPTDVQSVMPGSGRISRG